MARARATFLGGRECRHALSIVAPSEGNSLKFDRVPHVSDVDGSRREQREATDRNERLANWGGSDADDPGRGDNQEGSAQPANRWPKVRLEPLAHGHPCSGDPLGLIDCAHPLSLVRRLASDRRRGVDGAGLAHARFT